MKNWSMDPGTVGGAGRQFNIFPKEEWGRDRAHALDDYARRARLANGRENERR